MKTMKEGEEHSTFTDRLVRLLAGELSEQERADLMQEINTDQEKADLFRDYSLVWDRVGDASEAQDLDIEREWQLFSARWDGSGKDRAKGRVLTLMQHVYRIAAVIVLGFMLFAGYRSIAYLSSTTRYLAGNEPELIILPDGSRITLNRGSVLRAFKKEGERIRQIRLEGEAFFEVARDTLHPFVIEAGGTVVEVLGTSFNVNAYRENDRVEVTVSSGIVAFSSKNESGTQVVLKAGNSGIYEQTERSFKLVQEADPNAIAWKTRKLVFNNSPLSDVLSRINQVYATNIRIDTPGLGSCPLTVSFDQQSLESVLTVLESTLNLTISRKGSDIIISGEGCD